MQRFSVFIVAIAAVCTAGRAEASDLRLAALFSDHAVVQRDVRVPVWGHGAAPFGRLEAKLGNVTGVTRASKDGSFMFRLPEQAAGGPYELTVRDESGASVVVKDVYVGEVWLASGQSNMEYRMRSCEPGAEPGDHPLIRQFGVRIEGANLPLGDVEGDWRVATEAAIPDFGAAGYFFAESLQRKFPGVAVGIVLSALGGTSILSWSSRPCLMLDEEGARRVEAYEADAAEARLWDEMPQPVADLGPAKCEAAGWATPSLDDASWDRVTLPSYFSEKACCGRAFNGAVWFRKEVEIPARWANRRLVFRAAQVDKHDVTYFGGKRIGASGFGFDQHFCNAPRIYKVNPTLVRAGRTVVTIRCWSQIYGGGVHGKPEELCLYPEDDPSDRLELAGAWRAKIERDIGRVVGEVRPLPGNTGAPYALYDAAIAPLVPYALRGILWYQGGSDGSNVAFYRRWQANLIRDWRRTWGQGDLPFAITLQAGFKRRSGLCMDTCPRAELREAQILAGADVPNVGVVCTTDVGDELDAHPKNKKAVGERLCAWAMGAAYGCRGAESPSFAGFELAGRTVRVRFRHAENGLRVRPGSAAEVGCCAVAGADGVWHAAKGVIDGNALLISAPEVLSPRHARYAWTDHPDATANLENAAGLPALPFRTGL